ncbi:uncharacterized protein LOC122093056 [Macadamia integrifolia]|uniref:uncharacterized protein LOC122093056 n=1 Tax=Macadamia integrifolia TaxID=60698 RepID=UPI001C52DEA9|nr:uncharacterized protein LOC122093056 [Macadamia integrifolia]
MKPPISKLLLLAEWQLIRECVWKRIWACKTLPKIKSFIWRSCVEGLASDVGLCSCRIPINPSCQRCGCTIETNDHILLDCSFARAVWFGSTLSFVVSTSRIPKLHELLANWDDFLKLDKNRADESLGLCSFIYWKLWIARNDLIFGRRTWSPEEVIQAAQMAFSEFWTATNTHLKQHSNPFMQSQVRWLAPPLDMFKLNCDAALPFEAQKGGVGYVCDHTGTLIFAVSEAAIFSNSSIGEAMAIRAGLNYAVSAGLYRIQVESDCQEVSTENKTSDNPNLLVIDSQPQAPTEIFTRNRSSKSASTLAPANLEEQLYLQLSPAEGAEPDLNQVRIS